mmetsp:Transcript_81891/g.210975  ORF Transcript_81891/g.210975 Transcript_81891/m.210975 type:complete len:635 (+) Transcript_81891:177-2081(+)
MEYYAVAKEGVCVYAFQPGEKPGEPIHRFPAVTTADGCVWSADGTLLGLADPSGGVAVHNAAADYAAVCRVPPLVGGPVRSFYFSPLGNHLVTYERYVKDAGANVGVWDAKTGEMKTSFILKKCTEMTWPPMKWTALETHCCRMVQDGVLIMPGNLNKDEGEGKIEAPGIIAFEMAPKGAQGQTAHCAIVIGEAKGAPARCQVFNLSSPKVPTATKTFYKAQTVTMLWNNTGSSLLVHTQQEVDDTGKSYYGGSHLYFMRADGEESCIISSPDDGAIHDVQWNPTQDEFLLIHGTLPCAMTLHDGKKGVKKMDFGTGHRNTIRFNTFGRFLALGGYGQLLGDTDFWDKPGKKLLGTTRLECCVVSGWAPDGRHFLAATTSPRMRVDNKIVMYDYCGQLLETVQFEELLMAGWRPRPRGAFQDRPPSPGRDKPAAKAAAPEPKKQAYRPPGARGGGGLAELLRNELGSTSADKSTTATKVFGGASVPTHSLPPGCAPEDLKQAQGGGGAGGNSRADRRKKAKAAQQAADEAAEKEKLAAALSPQAGGNTAKPKAKPSFDPPARAEKEEAGESSAPAAEGEENAEVEKKIRAVRKKLRDIAKLKEKADKDLDPLQREKIAGEADLVQQIRDLGAEP